MKGLIIIDDDERFMGAVQERFRDKVQVYTSAADAPEQDGIKLAKKYEKAFVFIGLDTNDQAVSPMRGALYVAGELAGEGGRSGGLAFCGNDLPGELPAEVRDTMRRLNIRYVDKLHIVEEIETILGLKRSRSRDQGWITNDKDAMSQYAGQLVAVYDCKVWGSGETLEAALKEALAQPGAPPSSEFLLANLPPPPDENAWFPDPDKPSDVAASNARR